MITNRHVLQSDKMKKYVKILKDNDLKVTPQRLEILKYLDENRTHPSVDDIYSDLKKTNPSLSKTTVYNSLNILNEYNIIQSLTISGSELRYDYETGIHHHFLCKECNKIIDINIKCPNMNAILDGHRIDEVHGYFKGTCKECLAKKKSMKDSLKNEV